jgi:NDP-sugar pyrophosphorylase family protein
MTSIVILMAGEGKRFSEFKVPKPFIENNGIPLFHLATKSFDKKDIENKFIFIMQKKHQMYYDLKNFLDNNYLNYEIVIQNGSRNGPAETANECYDIIDLNSDMYIVDCDQYTTFNKEDMEESVEDMGFDGAVITFKSDDPSYSYVFYNEDGRIMGIHEKVVVSNMASSGIYFWKKAKTFFEGYKNYKESNTVNGEIYISSIYNSCIDNGFNFLKYESKGTVPLGDTYKYLNFFNNMI